MRKKRPYFKIVILLILAVLLILVGFKIHRLFKLSLWEGNDYFNLVVATAEDFYLLLLKPGKSPKIMVIPKNVYLEVPPAYGSYPLSSVYSLGTQEWGEGGLLLRLTMSDFLGAPVEGWLLTEEKLAVNNKGSFSRLALSSLFNLKVKTNLGWLDRWQLFLKFNPLERGNPDWLSLEEKGILNKEKRVDGKVIFKVNHFLLEEKLFGFFEKPILREEAKRLVVFNASGFEGLASRVSRLLRNLGFLVVRVDNLPCQKPPCLEENSKVYLAESSLSDSATLKEIKKLFKVEVVEDRFSGVEANLVLILGQNFWQEFKQNSSNYHPQ